MLPPTASAEATTMANDKMKKFCREAFTEISNEGINKVITKKNLDILYDKYCR